MHITAAYPHVIVGSASKLQSHITILDVSGPGSGCAAATCWVGSSTSTSRPRDGIRLLAPFRLIHEYELAA
jgi:hypothetical protein